MLARSNSFSSDHKATSSRKSRQNIRPSLLSNRNNFNSNYNSNLTIVIDDESSSSEQQQQQQQQSNQSPSSSQFSIISSIIENQIGRYAGNSGSSSGSGGEESRLSPTKRPRLERSVDDYYSSAPFSATAARMVSYPATEPQYENSFHPQMFLSIPQQPPLPQQHQHQHQQQSNETQRINQLARMLSSTVESISSPPTNSMVPPPQQQQQHQHQQQQAKKDGSDSKPKYELQCPICWETLEEVGILSLYLLF